MEEKERQTVLEAALAATSHGLSVVPVTPGTKKANGLWKHLQERILTPEEIHKRFQPEDSIALICGKISGNLELLDFDIPDKHLLPKGQKGTAPKYEPFKTLCEQAGKSELLKQLVRARTPSGGMGLIYRCQEPIEGSQKLAQDQAHRTLIETRGERGYFLIVPSPGYSFQKGNLKTIPTISKEDRDFLISTARKLNECEPTPKQPTPKQPTTNNEPPNNQGNRPGDILNKTATWEEILIGWTISHHTSDGRTHWIRPGKTHGEGATTGNGDKDLLYVHTTNAHPFQANQTYDKFAAYTLLNHNGNFSKAAKALRKSPLLPSGEKGVVADPAEGKSKIGRGRGGNSLGKPNATNPNNQQPTNHQPTNRQPTNHQPTNQQPTPTNKQPILKTKTFKDETFTPVKIEFLVRPYLPKGKCVLLDADGGTGKTSLALAWAAELSGGREPLDGARRQPARTLYLHKAEDGSKELATVFHANRGHFRNIEFYESDLCFDQEGLAILERTIVKKNIDLVVVDSFFYFLTGLMEDTYNALPALGVMQRLNAVALRTGCTFWNVRHTRKGVLGTKASEMGMGSVQFRNSHRGQMLLRYHPQRLGVVVATDEKGSLLVPKGSHFCYEREGLEINYLQGLPNPFEMAEDPRTEMARQLLKHHCAHQWLPANSLKELADQACIGWRTVQRAAKEMGVRYKKLADSTTAWTLMQEEVQLLLH